MGTTTKMAIPYPEATGLVKDGWEDMKDIATQVDAKSGLVLITTASFSAVSSQTFNDVFSANYDNYYLTGNTSITGGDIAIRWRVSGADNSTSNYQYGLARKDFGAGNFVNDTQSTTATSYAIAITNTGSNMGSFAQNINNPFATQRTAAWGMTISPNGGYAYYSTHLFNATTSFTGFSLLTTSPFVMTGSVSLYGYNK